MVIKPLPNTFIGRTCLVTYPLEGGRVFPALRPYTSNLFGLNLSASSLAFQEQDSTVAACATESLWSAFQMTASIFDHSIPSPFTITSIATKQVSSQSRSFPNKGLTPEQMGRAISEYELEPYFIQLDPTFNERRNQLEILQNNLYAYVSAGIPMLFLHYLHPLKEALHSATIAGFCLSEARTRTSFNLRSERINKFYAHDDRVGPFARFEIHDDVVNEGGKERWVIRTSLSTPDYAVGTVRAIPHLLLAPLYHKIRVPFQMVYEAIFEFDAHIGPVIQELAAEIPKGIEWDIKLTTVNKYKATLFASDTQDRRVLFKPLPRFIWQASALDYRDEKRCLFEILFDATDLEQGKLFLALVEHDEATFIPLAAALKGQEARVADPIARRIVAAFGAKSGDLGVA